ncbi:MAG: hypothetical protein E7439_04915 [Ruminococcaceae bacterium]|nr:hypothetical protein [Oscillospiraceae bacterium]
MSSCFFIGHRETKGEIYPQLEAAIEHHITQCGVREFIVGNYGAFDRVVARALAAAKVRHPEITLLLLVPYHPAERPTETPSGFDSTFYPPGMENVPRKFAIVRANRYMVEHVDYLIAYVWHPASNARDLLAYAERRRVTLTNLGEGHRPGE